MNKSKVIRITSGTITVLEDLQTRLENIYFMETGGCIDLKQDDIIRNALIAQIEQLKKKHKIKKIIGA